MREWLARLRDRSTQDARYAVRGLVRARAFTATVVLTFGLGIGANTAIFGVIDRLMFRPFAYLRDPGTVHRVYLQATSRGRVRTSSVFPYARYLDLRREGRAFSQYAGFAEWSLAVGTGVDARERTVAGVSASFFAFFDARPSLGRFFDAAEDSVPRGADVAVLGYDYWMSELGGRDVVGTSLQVGPLATTIIGVAPPGFVGIAAGEPPAVFMPITAFAYALNQGDAQTFATRYTWDWMSVMVRRRPGVSVAAASADLTSAFIRSRQAQRLQNPRYVAPDSVAHPRAIAGAPRTAAGPDAGLESRTLLWVSGVAIIVLLIACANVANLMLARVLRGRREIAVRLALGVSRRRLVAQSFIESAILAALGCAAGIVIAQWVSGALRQLLVRDGSSRGLVDDWRTLAAACGVALVASVLTATGPALVAVRGDLGAVLRGGDRAATHRRSRIRSTLLVVQGALSVVLLVGAGLFVRSLDNVRSMRLGWDAEPVLIVTPDFREVAMSVAAKRVFQQRFLEAAQSIPGVLHAARVNSLPFATSSAEIHVAGIDSAGRLGRFNYQATTPGYFETLGTRIVRGRAFTAQDRDSLGRVAVVSESMARALWPGRDPIGECFRIDRETNPCMRVIGVAEDVVQHSIADSERFLYYIADDQPPLVQPAKRLALRMSARDAATEAERVRRALRPIMPGHGYVTVTPLADLVDAQRRSWTLGASMFAGFGVLALIVAAVGLYGVVAYDVEQRMRELGIRIALGAGWRHIVGLVMMRGLLFVASGVSTGAAVALVAARWVEPLLFRESATDPAVFTAAGTAICVVSLIASAIPATRATRADPSVSLRSE